MIRTQIVAYITIYNIQYKQEISDPASYRVSQTIGEYMRDKSVEAFNYISALAADQINIGIFNCKAICNEWPDALRHWSCITKETSVTIRNLDDYWNNLSFELDQFLVNGILSAPAV